MDDKTVMGRAGRYLCEWAAMRDLPTAGIWRALRTSAQALDDAESRLPLDALYDALEHVTRLTQDPRIGFTLARSWGIELFDLLGFVVYTSPTVGASFERFVQFKELWSDGEDLWTEDHPEDETLHVFWRSSSPPRLGVEIMADMVLTDILGGFEELLGRRLPIHRVLMPYTSPEDRSHHDALTDAPVEFGGPWLLMILGREMLEWPMPAGDEVLHGYFVEQASRRHELVAAREGIAARVRRALAGRLVGGAPTLEEIATELGASERTVQRWLSAEGTSYSALLDATREEFARVYLSRGLTVAEVSWLLGFSEPRALHRAFKRWTGQTPSVWANMKHDEPQG